MLTENEARKIGVNACAEKIGYEFCKLHEDNSVSAYGKEEEERYYCFVGVSDQPPKEFDLSKGEMPILTSRKKWPYYASCYVNMEDGSVEFIEYKTSTNEVLEHHEQA